MIEKKKIKPKAYFKKLLIVALYFLIAWVLILLIATIILYINKDDISRKLLLSLNGIQEGEITLEDISFKPFAQFPSVSIGINNIVYYEHPVNKRDTTELPIGKFNEIYAAINILDLIGGKINVSEVTIDGGTLNFVTYKDSSVNLFNALGINKPAHVSENKKLITTESLKTDTLKSSEKNQNTSAEEQVIDIKIEQLTIKNLTANFENQIFNRTASYNIKILSSSFHHQPALVNGSLQTDININFIHLSEKIFLENKQLSIETNFSFDREKLFIDVGQSQFSLGDAKFDFKGSYDIKNNESVNFEIDGSDRDFSFFSLVLSDKGMQNLKKGDFYLHGTIKGNFSVGIPIAEFSFGVKDVNLYVPLAESSISNLNFSGYFYSGDKRNFSNAYLKIDTLYAQLPDGYVNGKFWAKDFVSPYIEINYDLKTKLDGLDEIFNMDFIENLGGFISITDEVKGTYSKEQGRIISDINKAEITFDNVSFNLPGIMDVKSIDGILHRNLDQLEFRNVKILSGDTDLLVNGNINNFLYVFFNEEKIIDASLKIRADMFDLPNFLSFDPSIGRDFPYRVKNLDLIVNANSTTSKLLEFDSFPEIDFNIKKLAATAEGFLPPLTINNGRFKVSENILGFHMDFDHFLFDIANGQLNLNGDYNSSKHQPFYIKAGIEFDDINPAKFLFDDQTDTIPDLLNGSLNGSLFTELQFATDTMAMKLVNIKRGNLNYYFGEDTIETKSLELFAKDVYYNSVKDPNPLATLTTNLLIKSKELYTDYFKVEDIYYDINADQGTYTIIPKDRSFFGSEGKGKHTLKPFDEVPNYRFLYSINQFNTEDLMRTFSEDTVLTGKMDFSMDITMQGNGWDSLVSKLNGDIYLAGKNLIMYGLDTDGLLEKFKRSQRFTLVDVGAVLLAGPVGIAVTKGTDYASMIVLNSGEETNLTNLVSDWSINNGKLTMQDVAFSTKKNRIAGEGWLNFATDSLQITIALLDKNGCSIFSQDLYGSFSEPETGDIKVVGTILAPVTNILDDVFGTDCEVFYNGSVEHPK
jgi:AsmA protein